MEVQNEACNVIVGNREDADIAGRLARAQVLQELLEILLVVLRAEKETVVHILTVSK